MISNKKVSCIIPAYNEGPRIGSVLSVVSSHPKISEVIVIDDGSIDNTSAVVENYSSVQLIRLSRNQGKCGAVFEGVRRSQYPIVLLLDADLHGLQATHIDQLLDPMLSSDNPKWIIAGARDPIGLQKTFGFDLLTGERVIPRENLLFLKEATDRRYGLEVLLNDYVITHHIPVSIVPLSEVTYKLKSEKFGIFRGWIEEFKMTWQIAKTIGLWKTVQQLYWYLTISYRYHHGLLS